MRFKKVYTILVILFLFCLVFAEDTDEVSQYDKIKSVFIYNFTKYIQWPAIDSSKVFVIGVFGNSKITLPLQKIAEKKTVYERKIQIKQFYNIENIDECHILFVSSTEHELISDILQKIKRKNILTVGEIDEFSIKGGIINLVLIDGKIKFEMNLKALDRAGLSAGSQLLKLAILIDENE